MRKRFLTLLWASLLITGLVRPNIADANIVLISCLIDTVDSPASRSIRVVGASSSANAPEIPTGGQTNCAQTLAVLLKGGFELVSVEGGSTGALYTLYQKK